MIHLLRSLLLYKKVYIRINRKMSSWQKEKDKYLNMKPEEKQKSCITLEKIPTWKYLADAEKLPDPILKEENCPIDISKNNSLAQKISIFEGDITKLAIDAIVNAANSKLQGGGGVDGAIHRVAGPSLKLEGATLAPCETGDAKITGGYQLPAKYVIHTVGPRLENPGKLEKKYVHLLEKCYKNSLQALISNNLRTVAFPCISTGIYGYPNLPAAHTAAYQVRKFLEEHDEVDRVIFCLFLEQDKQIYRKILQSYFPQ